MKRTSQIALLVAWMFALVAFLSTGPGCSHNPPTPPTPPTPPPSDATPDKGVPVGPEELLRPAPGARLTDLAGTPVQAFMVEPCCNTFRIDGVETNSRWPMASEAFMDYAAQHKANFFHFRLGPFYTDVDTEVEWADVGGPYLPGGLEWNPNFWQKVRDLVWHARKLGAWVEVVPIDTWGCKYSQAGNKYMPWPAAEINACGRQPSLEQERYLRKTVEELGCFDNVIWLIDNEGGNIIGDQVSWYLWVRDTLQDEQKKSGCNFAHMIGTNSGHDEVERAVDYVAVHARATLNTPKAGRWTINNEHNPAFTPEVEAGNFKVARNLGLAWALWRAGMDDASFEKTLDLFQAVVEGTQAKCLAGTCPQEKRYIVAKKGQHNYLDSTERCRDRAYCEAATGILGTTDCALGVEGTDQRLVCELEHSPGCLRWYYKDQGTNPYGTWERCLPPQHPVASCDHFDRWIFWQGPYTGQCETDGKGEPIAGFEMVPHGATAFRACDTAGQVCSNEVLADQ